MKSYRRLVVATDFSTGSKGTIGAVEAVAGKAPLVVHLVHVLEPIAYMVPTAPMWLEHETARREGAHAQLERFGAVLEKQGDRFRELPGCYPKVRHQHHLLDEQFRHQLLFFSTPGAAVPQLIDPEHLFLALGLPLRCGLGQQVGGLERRRIACRVFDAEIVSPDAKHREERRIARGRLGSLEQFGGKLCIVPGVCRGSHFGGLLAERVFERLLRVFCGAASGLAQ
jgi:hypothetical protein